MGIMEQQDIHYGKYIYTGIYTYADYILQLPKYYCSTIPSLIFSYVVVSMHALIAIFVFVGSSPVVLSGLSPGGHKLKVIPSGCGRNRMVLNLQIDIM